MKNIKIKKIIFVLLFFVFCLDINATSTLSNAIQIATEEYLSGQDYISTYSKYIQVPNSNKFYLDTYNDTTIGINTTVLNNKLGGLLSKREFDITKKGKSNRYSYLFEADPFWTYTKGEGNKIYIVNGEDKYINHGEKSGTKVTEYLKTGVEVVGSGSYTDPWIFIPQYKVRLVSNDEDKGVIVTPEGENKEIEFVTSRESTRDIEIQAKADYQYLGNTCGVIVNDFDIRKDPTKNIIKVQGVSRDIECTINFGEKPIRVEIEHTGVTTKTIPETLYVIKTKDWYADEFGNDSISKVKTATKEGYKIKGYYTSPNTLTEYNQNCTNGTEIIDANGTLKTPYKLDETLFNSMKLHPCFRPIRYTVKFNCGEGATGTITDATHTYANDNNKLPSSGCTKTGYTFKGWTGSDGTNYNAGQVVTLSSVEDSVVTLTARYEKNQYQITYSLGTGGNPGTKAPTSARYDTPFQISYAKKAGNSFEGWTFSKTGGKYGTSATSLPNSISSTTTAYKAEWFDNLVPSGSVTLTATWKLCPAGKYNSGSSSSCTACAAGYISAQGASSCTICQSGTYSNSEKTACTKCAAGTYNPDTGASSSAACKKCAAGQYSAAGSSTCSTCAAGQYSAAGASSCTSCPAGTYSAAGANSCTKCPAGYYCPGGTDKIICPAGQYSGEGASSCTKCATGKYNTGTGNTTCKNCSAGTYNTGTGNTTCTNCAAGTYSSSGASSCTACAAGTYNTGTGNATCTKCPAGKYNTGTGNTTCTNCPAGKYNTTEGSTTCTNCPAGKYNTGTGNTTCTNCPAGKYNTGTGNTTCTNCPAGQYNTTAGSTSCTACAAGTYNTTTGNTTCTNCPAGKYNTSTGNTTCTACPAGQYASGTKNTGCSVCPAGTYSAAGAATCTACAAGTYSSSTGSTSCANCQAGTYSTGTGNTSCTACATCYTNTAGSSTCPSKVTYTVTFNANGGTGGPTTQTKTCGQTLTLTTSKPTRSGYTFLGWNTNSGGTGTTYASGGSYTGNAGITLYAQWKQSCVLPIFTYTGSYQLVKDDDTVIASGTNTKVSIPSSYSDYTGNWKIRFLTDGTLTFHELRGAANGIDVFLVGGGGNGGSTYSSQAGRNGYAAGGGGGGGGYRTTKKGVSVSATSYSIDVGAARAKSTAFGQTANPGNDGSGGYANLASCEGGPSGGTGGASGGAGIVNLCAPSNRHGSAGGKEFGESQYSKYYGGGGGGGHGHNGEVSYSSGNKGAGVGTPGNGGTGGGGTGNNQYRGANTHNGAANTGGGGGGASFVFDKYDAGNGCWSSNGCFNVSRTTQYPAGTGGTGIVIIRNKR